MLDLADFQPAIWGGAMNDFRASDVHGVENQRKTDFHQRRGANDRILP